MNTSIRIDFIAVDTSSKAYRSGTFELKGRKPEKVAYDFWKWIQKEVPVELQLEKVIIDGVDITELVKELEKAPLD
jgi:hypothetical protein